MLRVRQGAVAAGADLIYWGERGLSFWSRETRHEVAVSACLRIGQNLAALTERGLELFDAALRPVAQLSLPNRGMLISVKRRLLVAVPDGLAVVDVENPAKPVLVGTAPVGHIDALSAWSAPKSGGTVSLRLSSGEFVTFDASALPAVRPLVTYQRRPWAFGAARLRQLVGTKGRGAWPHWHLHSRSQPDDVWFMTELSISPGIGISFAVPTYS